MFMNKNIHPVFDRLLNRSDRQSFLGQRSKVLWFTGLSGSGKSTLAEHLERMLFNSGFFVQVLDGDNIRSGINNNLTFSNEDRIENIRRIAEISKLYLNSGVITINSFISPTIEIRELAKTIIGKDDFVEIFIDTPLALCEQRDVKGLYKKARRGDIKGFTGIDAPYEAPEAPDLIVKTANKEIVSCVQEIYEFVHPLIKTIQKIQ